MLPIQQLKLAGLVIVLAMLLSCSAPGEKDASRKPNIVLIMTDDQGWGDLSLTGNPYLNTPNIDQMAEDGIFFNRFYVSPVCSPTRAELLTGRYHPRAGVYSTSRGGERMDADETTVAELLLENGYKTAAYGKWHNGTQYPYHPNARGFEDFYGFASGHWGNYFSPMLEHNGKIVTGDGYLVDDLTNRAMEFMEENQEGPFFVYLPYNTPHSPMQVPDRWWKKFKDMPLDVEHRYEDREKKQHTRAAYAMCENIDWNVGRLLDKLEELGIENNTIVMYLSDNGPNGWRWIDGLEGRKGRTDEGGARSPFVLQWKGTVEPGLVIDEVAGNIDILPTIMDITGIPVPGDIKLDGKSIKPLLMNDTENWPDRYIFSFWGNRLSLRNKQYILDHEDKLFDLLSDPGQTNDISAGHPEIVEQMKAEKKEWRADVLSELDRNEHRPFTVGHPDFELTHLPARDARAHGTIERSNGFPNCSFFRHWTSTEDSLTWDVEVLKGGTYDAIVYYTCEADDTGARMKLSFKGGSVTGTVKEAHDPPLEGMEHDRFNRMESYVKDFKPWNMGTITLTEGKGIMAMTAEDIPGDEAIEMRLLILERVE